MDTPTTPAEKPWHMPSEKPSDSKVYEVISARTGEACYAFWAATGWATFRRSFVVAALDATAVKPEANNYQYVPWREVDLIPREVAIVIARRIALKHVAGGPTYLADVKKDPNWMPHEWVIEAMQDASRWLDQKA